MNEKSTQEQIIQSVYGALVGGLISSFLAVAVLTVFIDSQGGGYTSLWAALIGLGSAVALMAAGLALADRVPWLGTALLFGSAFTALWSVVLSFTAQPRWVTLVALAVVIVIAALLGKRRFGRASGVRGAHTPGGMPEPLVVLDPPVDPATPPVVPSPELAPPLNAPEIVLPPVVHPVDGGDIRD